jgi:hypothetical protein
MAVMQVTGVPVASCLCSGLSFRSLSTRNDGTGNAPKISLRPLLVTEHHFVSTINDGARQASPSSRCLHPARAEDTAYTVGGNCSRVDGDKRTDNVETRSYSPDASVDPTDARKATVRRFSRSDRRAQGLGPRETLCPCPLIAANGEPNTMNMPEQCADVIA